MWGGRPCPPYPRNLVVYSRITILKLMRIEGKILATLLLLSVTTTLLGESMMQSPILSQRPASCHEHGHRPARSPAPVSHLCCNAGHRAAILPERVDLGCSLIQIFLPSECLEPPIRGNFFPNFSNTIVLPGDPPGKAPLRI